MKPLNLTTFILAVVLVCVFGSVQANGSDSLLEKPEDLSRVHAMEPQWPIEALKKQKEGEVTLRLFVDESGEITDVRVIKSTADGLFDQAALDAARKWRFEWENEEQARATTFDQVISFQHAD